MLKNDCDSFDTGSLPDRDDRESDCSALSRYELKSADISGISDLEIVPAAISDVSFFNDSKTENLSYDDDDALRCTLAVIKPDAIRYMYKIESLMMQKGFVIQMRDVLHLTEEQTAEFYREHELELYFPRLVDHMSSGPIAVYVLEKTNCVREWQQLIGPANVRDAKKHFPLSFRALYGTEMSSAPVANAFHGSDSPTAAKREIRFFFPNVELDKRNANDQLQYIRVDMMPTIMKGLTELFKVKPNDPLRWFGNWLLNNNEQNS